MSISNIILQHLSSLALSAGLAGDPSAAQMVEQLEAGNAGRGHIMRVCAGESCTKEQRAELRSIASDAQADVKELRKAMKATQRELARTMGRGEADPEEVATMLAELQAMSDELTGRRAVAHDAAMAVIDAEAGESREMGDDDGEGRGKVKANAKDKDKDDRGKPDKADAKGKTKSKADAKGKTKSKAPKSKKNR